MLIKSIENKPTYLAWPSGEWSESLLQAVMTAGIGVEGKTEKSYVFSLPALNILCTICRSTDVPQAVQRITSRVKAGITGEDAIYEYATSNPDDLGYFEYEKNTISIGNLVPSAPKPQLRWGLTPNGRRKFGSEDWEWNKLASGVIFTSYPRLAQRSMSGLTQTTLPIVDNAFSVGQFDTQKSRIERTPGKIEGLWRIYPYNYLIADIVDKGETATENEIELIGEPILSSISLQMLTSLEKVSSSDWSRLQQLLEIVAEANSKKSVEVYPDTE